MKKTTCEGEILVDLGEDFESSATPCVVRYRGGGEGFPMRVVALNNCRYKTLSLIELLYTYTSIMTTGLGGVVIRCWILQLKYILGHRCRSEIYFNYFHGPCVLRAMFCVSSMMVERSMDAGRSRRT